MPALLRYIVREELAGRGNRIKSFSIATEVLGRRQDFDPQSDSIARAEMTRLRKAIEHYNASVGASDLMRITIPKGSYRPILVQTPIVDQAALSAPASPEARHADWIGPVRLTLLIAITLGMIVLGAGMMSGVFRGAALPSSGTGAGAKSPLLVSLPATGEAGRSVVDLTDAIQAEIAAELSRQPWLTVIRPASLAQIEPQLITAARTRAVYLVETRISELEGTQRVTTFLKRWPDQAIRWSGSRDGSSFAQHSTTALAGVAAEIARDLATPGGAITIAEVARLDDDARHEKRFVCLMSIRRYWRSYDPATRAEAETCINASLVDDPDFMSGRAALALLRIESARQRTGADRDRLLAEAAMQLVGANDANLLGEIARMALAACMQDHAALRAVADRLMAAYPNNPDVLADVGSKLGLALGDWPKALEAEARAMALNPAPDPWYPLASMTKALLDGEPGRAFGLLSKASQRSFHTGQIIRLALGGAAGDASLIADAASRLGELGIPDHQAAVAAIDGECWSADVKRAFRRGVEAAIR